VFYRGYLEGGRNAAGRLLASINGQNEEDVEPIFPHYQTEHLIPKSGKTFYVNTPVGRIRLSGKYGQLTKDSTETKNRRYYYRYTMESQGVDFRIDKRVVATRLLTEIWGVARHNTLNGLWGEFCLHPSGSATCPSTLNNKTSLSFDDPIWIAIAEEIKQRLSADDLPRTKYGKAEQDLQDLLVKQLKAHFSNQTIQDEYSCFGGANVIGDIVRKSSSGLVVYEAKAGRAYPLDVYQLRLYWDGLVHDGAQPTEGILVVNDASRGAKAVMRTVNGLKDKNGVSYKLSIKKWSDFGINP
jgi:hypothetical protein